MSIFSGLFKKGIKKNNEAEQPSQNRSTTNQVINTDTGKPRAIAFVDYEHWYISLNKLYHIRPDIKSWRNKLAKDYELKEIMFFGDFSNNTLRLEIPHIREITNYIIETQNASQHHKKDFTDFIMLDHIYQKALASSDIDIFIIFSGDGHFSSVVSFLTTRIGKPVGIYGIKDAVSAQLKNCASWTVELPEKEEDPLAEYYQMILRNLMYVETSNEKQKSPNKIKSFPTFWGTIEAATRYNKADKDKLVKAMRAMIDKGYLYQSHERVNQQSQKKVKVLNIDWDKVKRDEIWSEPAT